MSFSFRFWPRPLWGLALLALPVLARAQSNAPVPPLTLPAALQLAVENHPALAAQYFQEQAAEALIEQAGVIPNPTLEVGLENFAGTGSRRGVDELESTVQLSQTIERGGKRARRLAFAQSERTTATLESSVARAEVLAATATAYVEVLAAQQRLTLAAEPWRVARETLAAVEARVQAGASSLAESARARAALASARVEFARAETSLASARAALAAIWGVSAPDLPASTAGRIHVPGTLPAPTDFLAGLETHPRLALQKALIEGRRSALGLEQSRAVGDIAVSGGLRFLREGSDAAFVAGLSFPLPMRHQNQGNIRASRAQLAGAERAVAAVENELRAAFTAAWQDFTAAHAAAISLRTEALPATEEAHRVVLRAYEQGQLPLLEVLDAQRALAALQRDILEQEVACLTALVRVEALTDPSFSVTISLLSLP